MKEKGIFLFSIFCLMISVFLSIILIGNLFVVLKDEPKTCKEKCFTFEENNNKTENTQLFSIGEFKLTAYCPCEKCCGEWALKRPKDENGNDIVYGSTGEILVSGKSIAVDPKVISYGSEVYINGNKYIAQDCGGLINGERIDLYFENHQDALNFGVQYAEVFLNVDQKENK